MSLTQYSKAIVYVVKDHVRKVLRPRLSRRLDDESHRRRLFYGDLVSPGDLVFDVGANLGNRVRPLLMAGAKVIAFEPQLFCYYYLKLRFGKRIVVVNAALGAEKYTGEILLNKDSTTIASMSAEWRKQVGSGRFNAFRWGKPQTVQVDTLQNQVERFGTPGFVKIDVEGFEEEVLKGLSSPVAVISFEYTTPEMQETAIRCLNLVSRLSPGYEFNYAAGENTFLELERWISSSDMRALITGNIDALKGFGDIYARLKQ